MIEGWDARDFATMAVALIAAISAYASQRAAARASIVNTATSSRDDREREAYERARKYDVETIERQDEEISELKLERDTLKAQVRELLERVGILERKVSKYEKERT